MDANNNTQFVNQGAVQGNATNGPAIPVAAANTMQGSNIPTQAGVHAPFHVPVPDPGAALLGQQQPNPPAAEQRLPPSPFESLEQYIREGGVTNDAAMMFTLGVQHGIGLGINNTREAILNEMTYFGTCFGRTFTLNETDTDAMQMRYSISNACTRGFDLRVALRAADRYIDFVESQRNGNNNNGVTVAVPGNNTHPVLGSRGEINENGGRAAFWHGTSQLAPETYAPGGHGPSYQFNNPQSGNGAAIQGQGISNWMQDSILPPPAGFAAAPANPTRAGYSYTNERSNGPFMSNSTQTLPGVSFPPYTGAPPSAVDGMDYSNQPRNLATAPAQLVPGYSGGLGGHPYMPNGQSAEVPSFHSAQAFIPMANNSRVASLGESDNSNMQDMNSTHTADASYSPSEYGPRSIRRKYAGVGRRGRKRTSHGLLDDDDDEDPDYVERPSKKPYSPIVTLRKSTRSAQRSQSAQSQTQTYAGDRFSLSHTPGDESNGADVASSSALANETPTHPASAAAGATGRLTFELPSEDEYEPSDEDEESS
ncbi:hypothetical protein F5Y17DRAFT_33287 [Xylariaceae sp. FL0594]|nr:hypothetical protein F5Y17DRAFT_33287 [Xylariaceae sp. FL0594]